MFNLNNFASVLIIIVLLSGVLGLVGVWFPDFFRGDTGWKLIMTFVVMAVTVAVATGVFQYLGK